MGQEGAIPKPPKPRARAKAPRKSLRVSVSAEVKLRRRGSHNFAVRVFDLSPEGCKVEFLERPDLEETVWVRFEGIEGIEATVCWIEGVTAGVEFLRPLHPAVFDLLLSRLR